MGVAVDRQGAVLVADDAGDTVWRVTKAETPAQQQSLDEKGSAPMRPSETTQ